MPVPLFEIKLTKKAVAVIKTGDRQLAFVKINKFDVKYFAVRELGVYELDDEYEYRYKNTSFYFYNYANSKPLLLSAMQEIDQTMRKFGDSELLNLPRVKRAIPENSNFDFSALPPDRTTEMTPETKRFLNDFMADDEAQKTNTMIKVHHQKRSIMTYSSPFLGMGINRSHFAIVEIAYKRLDIVPMAIHDDRAYTKYGVFVLSKDNIYLLKKQIISFFIANSKTNTPLVEIPKQAKGMMNSLFKKKRWDFLESFHKANGDDSTDPMPQNVSLSSEKSLVQYMADSPQIYQNTLKELHHTHNAVVTRISSLTKKAMPIMLVMAALMGFVILISNAPTIMDKVAELTGMQPPKVVYLTPDEARNLGLNPADIPIVDLEQTNQEDFCDKNPSKCDGDLPLSQVGEQDDGTPLMVVDELPLITVPDDIIVEATGMGGADVKFLVTAMDDVDGVIPVNCDPPSGKVFPIGETVVTCSATDSSQQTATATFKVTITGDEESFVENIIPEIQTPP